MYCKCPQIQSNNPKLGMPITTLRDYEVVADAGSKNPFSDTTATDGGTGTFTVYITSRPSKKYANSLALCPDSLSDKDCKGLPAVIIMRIYTSGM
jgi:hypothetical protein